MTKAVSILGLAISIGACLLAGFLGSLFTARSVGTWYLTLVKPAWNPPSYVFGPVWTALYLMMGTAAWFVWRKAGFAAALPLALFAIQLVLNFGWSLLFFGLHRPDLAFAEIVALWCLILATTIAFWRVVPAAAYLMLPYLAWVTFASALNFAIWRLNP